MGRREHISVYYDKTSDILISLDSDRGSERGSPQTI